MLSDTRNELAALHSGVLTKYRTGDYAASLEACVPALLRMLLTAYEKYFEDLDNDGKRAVLETIKEAPDLGEDTRSYSLRQFAVLLAETGCLTHIANSSLADSLVRTFDVVGIADLVDAAKHTGSETNFGLLRIAAQQILQMCTLLSYLLEVTDLDERVFLDGRAKGDSDIPLEGLERLNFVKKFFLFNEERGLLLNVADRTRNVAFKVETFGRLLTNVYEGMVQDLDGERAENIERAARLVVQNAGREAGSRFGRALNHEFQLQGSSLTLKQRIEQWCEFDSMVGFGRFDSSTIEVAEETNEISGAIQLHENFLIVGRTWKDENICCFMKGYIWGVLDELTGIPLVISHKKEHCGQFTLGSDTCHFHATVDDTEFERQKEEIEKIDLSEEL